MTITIRLFAGLRELAGDSVTVEVPTGATAGDVKRAVAALVPAAAVLIGRSAVAVGREFVPDSAGIADGAEVALIPPVSGG